MPKLAKYVAGALVFVTGVVGGNALYKWISSHSEGNVVAQQMVSKTRPDFSLPDTEGNVHNISEWDGKVTIVNFWATWCPPCRREIPALIELQETYESRGLQIVGVAIDTMDKVTDYMDTMGINYTNLIGEEDALKITKDYGNRFGALPYSAVIDREGKIRFIQRGELTKETAEKNIKPLL